MEVKEICSGNHACGLLLLLKNRTKRFLFKEGLSQKGHRDQNCRYQYRFAPPLFFEFQSKLRCSKRLSSWALASIGLLAGA
jgi:hypothetical protein